MVPQSLVSQRMVLQLSRVRVMVKLRYALELVLGIRSGLGLRKGYTTFWGTKS